MPLWKRWILCATKKNEFTLLPNIKGNSKLGSSSDIYKLIIINFKELC